MNEEINNKDYKPLTPFKGWVLENFPFIEADFDAINNYQLMCKVTEYLNNVIYNQNEVQDLATELVDGYNALLEYVNNYFDNLDLTQEVSNKLDEMAENGTLTNLIKNYVDPIQEEFETSINNEIRDFKNDVNDDLNDMSVRIAASYSGSPIPVSSTDDMTDTTKVYVNTTNGYWYYYDGDSWEQGGIYQSSVDSETENNLINDMKSMEYITDSIRPNIWNNTYSSQAETNGITWTKHSDGSFTVDGTATANAYQTSNITLQPGTYTLFPLPSGASSSTFHYLYSFNGTHYGLDNKTDLVVENETTISMIFRIMSGVEVDNLRIYPMITKKEYNYVNEYVPYNTIYNKYQFYQLLGDITGYKQVNLYNNQFNNQQANGLTISKNENNILHVEGTSTSDSATYFGERNIHLPKGKYIFSGIHNGSGSTYYVLIVYGENIYNTVYDGDSPFEITNDDGYDCQITIVIPGRATINQDFDFMIREADVTNSTYVPYKDFQIYKPINKLINYTEFNWSGKKLNGIGDSIMYGSYGNFINVIGKILNLDTVRNYGVGGCCMASKPSIDSEYTPVVLRYDQMDLDADIIIVHAGTNDYSAQIPLGDPTSTDIETFNGALNTIMTGLRTMYPDKLIIFNSILHRYNDGSLTIPAQDYRDAIEDRCNANHIVFYDCYKYSGFDFVKGYYDHVLTPDGLHPNQKGANILGRKEAGFINWQ